MGFPAERLFPVGKSGFRPNSRRFCFLPFAGSRTASPHVATQTSAARLLSVSPVVNCFLRLFLFLSSRSLFASSDKIVLDLKSGTTRCVAAGTGDVEFFEAVLFKLFW